MNRLGALTLTAIIAAMSATAWAGGHRDPSSRFAYGTPGPSSPRTAGAHGGASSPLAYGTHRPRVVEHRRQSSDPSSLLAYGVHRPRSSSTASGHAKASLPPIAAAAGGMDEARAYGHHGSRST